MNTVTPPEPQYPTPELVFPENAFSDSPPSVRLGEQLFTERQWELVQLYVEGVLKDRSGHKAQRQNRDFHTAMGIETPATPRAIPAEDVPVVIELIREEFIDELIPALGFKPWFTEEGNIKHLEPLKDGPDVVEIYDALIDILYVTYGAFNRAGMDAEPGYDEVQMSNMSKLGADGKPIIAGENDPDGIFPGRVKKGPNYFKPNLAVRLHRQGWRDDSEQVDFGGFEDH
jgi:predicted HAD superfamily Cof-like phosphohydrolase